MSVLGPVTVIFTGQSCQCLLCNLVIPILQQRGCVDRIIFMHDGAPPHIANSEAAAEATFLKC